MERENIYINYNELLDTLFDNKWICSYGENDRENFCRDGLMYKANGLNVDELWGNSQRRVMFILKDNPHGGHDTRIWLTNERNGEKNRNLRTSFIKKIAMLFYGLFECRAEWRINEQDVKNQLNNVKEIWNEKPFAFIEAKKISGGKTVSENSLRHYLNKDGDFFKEELDILKPNIIVCCDGTGDSIFNFVTETYLAGKQYFEYGGDYILESGEFAGFKTCLWHYPEDNIVVIKGYHPSARVGWKFFEKVISPFHAFLRYNHEVF